MKSFSPDRRKFLKQSTAVVGSSLFLGINLSCSTENSIETNQFSPNIWIKISPSDDITIIVAESEMGQGPYTLMPMMVAEELEVDWSSINVQRASSDPIYGVQMTGDSNSIKKGWMTLREAGAVVKQLFLNAAAFTMSVPVSECHAKEGKIYHANSGENFSYGQLVEQAILMELPKVAYLKDFSDFKIIGKPKRRKDTKLKINGKAIFGIDVKLPDQIYATVIHCPVFGGKVKSFDDSNIRHDNDIIDVFTILEGVAIVSKNTWSAFKARNKIKIEWNYGAKKNLSSHSILSRIKLFEEKNLKENHEEGDVDTIFKNRKSLIKESSYEQPFQAHMTMEPMNCTAHFNSNGKLQIWVPTQSPTAAYNNAKYTRDLNLSFIEKKYYQLKEKLNDDYDDSIEINTTFLGGGFGRRLIQDFVSEAVQIAQHYDVPVQLVWPREEDIQHDSYHPMTYHHLRAVLDNKGLPIAWEHIVGGGAVSATGALSQPYKIPNQRIKVYDTGRLIPKGPWRSVALHYNTFAVEHFLDEIAHLGNNDPVDLRLKLIHNNRLKGVLKAVAKKANWKGSLDGNKAFGVAVLSHWGSHVAQLVEIEKRENNSISINKIYCAFDCGIIINPDILKQQIEGSIIFGLSAAIKSKITIDNGRVLQSNFHDYPILRFDETPEIEVILLPNKEEPGGIGEPAVPPLAPALANALLALTGKPVRELPITFS